MKKFWKNQLFIIFSSRAHHNIMYDSSELGHTISYDYPANPLFIQSQKIYTQMLFELNLQKAERVSLLVYSSGVILHGNK